MRNIDEKVVAGFGEEWSRYDQTGMTEAESRKIFEEYFTVFPWEKINKDAEGFDMGCGSGRWAKHVAPRVGRLHCVEPSLAVNVARKNLANLPNIEFHQASLDDVPFAPCSQDFGYSLGVLHHVPDTAAAIRSCANFLKPGAPLLLYIYYAFDNRPNWFKWLWCLSDVLRRLIILLPENLKHFFTYLIALLIYWPLSRVAGLVERFNLSAHNLPLYYYRNQSFYTLKTDARDRFGTALEQRFTKEQIEQMMCDSGLSQIKFSDQAPFWCVVGIKE